MPSKIRHTKGLLAEFVMQLRRQLKRQHCRLSGPETVSLGSHSQRKRYAHCSLQFLSSFLATMTLPVFQAISPTSIPLTETHVMSPPVVSPTGPFQEDRSWWPHKSMFEKLRTMAIDLFQNNKGLLLIAASQLFMTFMIMSVKLLNELEAPVPTLEV